MIATLYDNDSPASRMLDLIARKAPLLMRVGGGSLSHEKDARAQTPHAMTQAKRARAIELCGTGLYTATDIARLVGSTQSAVFKALARGGLKAPDGRTVAMRRRVTT